MFISARVPAGPRPFRGSWRRIARAASLSLALAACTDRDPLAPAGEAPGEARQATLACVANVRTQQLQCGTSTPEGASRNLVLGGQDVYLRLSSQGTAYDGAVLESQVTVQNLLSQQIGSPDGTTVAGVRVFFVSEPAVTSGSGLVEIDNADGVATITGSGQPFFHYAEILEPRGSSQPKTWRFRVPPTVETFSFTVMVEAAAPAENGVLQWTRLHGRPGVQTTLRDVWGTSPRNVFAVGDGGAVLHYDGRQWQTAPKLTQDALLAVHGADARSVVAVGGRGIILRHDGNRWSEVVAPQNGTLADVWGTGSASFAVGWKRNTTTGRDEAWIRRSADGGRTWDGNLVGDPAASLFLSAVWGVSESVVYAAGYRYDAVADRYAGIILRSGDGGDSWETTPSTHTGNRLLVSLWASSPSDVYAVGYQQDSLGYFEGVILHSTDGGETWTPTASPYPRPAGAGPSVSPFPYDRLFQAVWGSGDTVYVSGRQTDAAGVSRGVVIVSTDGGSSWGPAEELPQPTGSVWSGGEGHTYAVGVLGMLSRRVGGAWVDAEPNAVSDPLLEDVWSPDGQTVFAVGSILDSSRGYDVGIIRRSLDGGATWTELPFPGTTGVRLRAVWGSSAGDVWAVGVDGAGGIVLHTTDGGASWTRVLSPFGQLYAVWGRSADEVYLAGERVNGATGRYEAAVYRRSAGWAASTSGASPRNRFLYDIWGGRGDTLVAVGSEYDFGTGQTDGLFMRSTDAGATWTTTSAGLGSETRLDGVWMGSTGRAVAVGQRRNAAGSSWEGLIFESSSSGAEWTLTRVLTASPNTGAELNAVWGGASGQVYAVGNFGKILWNDGAGWAEMSSGTRDELNGVWGVSPTSLFAVGLQGTVLRGHR